MSIAQMFEVNPHDSDVYCIPSRNIRKPTADIEQLETFEFGSALESYFPLLETVFDYLDCNDLKTCMLVNNLWRELAIKALQKRNSVGWISFVMPGGVLKYSKYFNYSNVSKSIIFYDYHCIKLDKYICLHESTADLSRMTFVEYVAKEVVPKNTDHCLLSCSSVTPIPMYLNSLTKEREATSKTPRAVFQGVSLPQIPDVNISLFHCNPKNAESTKTTISKHLKSNEEIKCLLLFTIHNPYRYIETFLNTILDGRDPKSLTLGGGIVKGMKTFLEFQDQKTFRSCDYFCITFQKDKEKDVEFDSASIVIPGDYLSEQEFKEYLHKLKLRCQQRLHGVAFRFCCAAKYDKDKETTLFNSLFPGIPLLGMDVDGEIGWESNSIQKRDRDNSKDVKENKKLKKTLPEMQHQWSTILVLITWGKLVNGGKF